jgi:hypothetical protein
MMLVAQSQRVLGELETDAAKSEQWKKNVLETLQKADALEFELNQIAVQADGANVALSGTFTNRSLPPSQTVRLRFTFLDETGATVATHEVTLPVPALKESARFSADIKTEKFVAGWRYEVVR